MISYWPLIGIALVVIGFAMKLNPMLVVTASALVTGLVAGMDPVKVVSTFGKAFNDNRIIAIVWIVLPVIGSLERFGLQQRAAHLIRSFKGATVGKLLILYLGYRQLISAIGLHSTAGHPQTVRPLLAPMALAAAQKEHGELTDGEADRIKAMAAATDNIGLFFGEDIFFAIGSIVLIQATLATYGYNLEPLQLALWAIPSAIGAFVIHGLRLWRFERSLHKSSPARGGGSVADGGGSPPAAPPLHHASHGPPASGRSVPRTELGLPGAIKPDARTGEDL